MASTAKTAEAEIHHSIQQSIASMCGPMQKKDPLHFVTLAIALMVLALSSGGIFNPNWVRMRTSSKDQHTGKIVYKKDTVSLWQIQPCASTNETVCYDKDYLQYTDSVQWVVGMWALAIQLISIVGLAFCILNILLQILNMFLPARHVSIQLGCTVLFAFSGLVYFVAGFLVPKWAGPLIKKKNGDTLTVEPASSGMLILSSILCVVGIIFAHVASHGPGLLSMNTRFAFLETKLSKEDKKKSRMSSPVPAVSPEMHAATIKKVRTMSLNTDSSTVLKMGLLITRKVTDERKHSGQSTEV